MSDILKDLNPEQLKAVTTTDGPLLIIAGAGTGKTTVIARRIAHIIEKNLALPSEILALTFTDKSAAEMEERVDVLVPYGFIDTWISTFHAFGERVLKENPLDAGLTPDFKVFSRPQQVLFFQQNLFRFNLEYYRPLGNPTKYISAILSFFSRLKDENISSEEFLKFANNQRQKAKGDEVTEAGKYLELAVCYESYEKFKAEAGFLDFGDLVVKTIKLFQSRPQILKNYQKRFKYILVDEYQDTNYSQNILVNLLASAHKNICVVGDDNQSIYRFRGAAVSNILEFKEIYPKIEQVILNKNYRSPQSILDSAYRLIKHNDPDTLEFRYKIDKKLVSQKGTGHPPQEIFTETISEEADAVADQIEKLMSKTRRKNVSGQLSVVSGYSYRDFAILVRANSQADNFLRALNMHGIPHKFVGSSGLYEQPEVNLIISFLTAISNVEDSLNLFNLLTSEIYQMPPLEAIKLNSYASRKNRSLFHIIKNLGNIPEEELEISEEAKVILEKVMEDIDAEIILSKDQSAGKVIYDFLKRTNYLEKLERIGGIDSQIKVQNIAKFFDKVKEFQDIAKIESVMQFVDYLTSLRDAGDDPATIEFDPDLDAVNVMTVHGAKGLEFPVVFMVNLVSDRFPSRHRKEAIELPETLIAETLPSGDWHIQEERRLFYVGMTRAKDILYFSWSRDVGGARAKKASPFVLEALDKPSVETQSVKLSPKEKIEKFAPVPPRVTQTVMFDVDVLKLTQGSIDDYLTCAYKYRYVHLLRIPILRHHSIAYGAALHNAIATFLNSKKQGNPLSLPQFLEVFENVWDSEGFLTPEHESKRKDQGKLALEKFWNREIKSPVIPSLIETGFKFVVNETTIVGRFDRVDVKPGGKIEIIDYKSSENIDQDRADAQAEESMQLGIYALYYWKKHNIIPEKLTLHFLETGIEGSYTPTEKDLVKVEKLIVDTAENILHDTKTNNFSAKPKYFGSVPACNYCAYNSICPFSLAKI